MQFAIGVYSASSSNRLDVPPKGSTIEIETKGVYHRNYCG
jgi:hypothetical protein